MLPNKGCTKMKMTYMTFKLSFLSKVRYAVYAKYEKDFLVFYRIPLGFRNVAKCD